MTAKHAWKGFTNCILKYSANSYCNIDHSGYIINTFGICSMPWLHINEFVVY